MDERAKAEEELVNSILESSVDSADYKKRK